MQREPPGKLWTVHASQHVFFSDKVTLIGAFAIRQCNKGSLIAPWLVFYDAKHTSPAVIIVKFAIA